MTKYFLSLFLVCFFLSNCKAQNATTNGLRLFLEKDSVTVLTNSQKKLYIVADSFPIYKNAILKIIFPKVFSDILKDGDFLANIRAGYTTAGSVSSRKTAKIIDVKANYQEFPTIPSSLFNYILQHDANQKIATIQLLDTLPQGDTLLINYGANGTSTYTANYGIAYRDSFVALLNNNTNKYAVVESSAKINFVPEKNGIILPVLSSTTKKGNPSILKLIIQDRSFNQAKNFVGTIQLTCTDNTATFPSVITFNTADKGSKDLPITFNQNGVFTISAKALTSNYSLNDNFISNPTNCGNDSLNIYFGELHTHTGFSRDGQGADGYDYAKYGNGLDFFCVTDHSDISHIDTFGISEIEWKSLKQQAASVNENGRFVSMIGYENSLDYPSGHYNFYYNYPDSLIDLVPNLSKHFNFNIQNLWSKLDSMPTSIKALTIPHTTALIQPASLPDALCAQFGGTFANDKYKRIIEIYSSHGLCESYDRTHNLSYTSAGNKSSSFPCYAQDGWAFREKLGVIASTDTHNGKGGNSNAGLVAIIADTLTRNGIFENLYNRHCYATTGSKIIVKFYVNDNIMGSEFTLPCDLFPRLSFEINGTDDLSYIEVLKWDFKNGTYTSNPVHPKFEVLKKITFTNAIRNYKYSFLDVNFKDSSLYYVRVKQKDIINNREVWAWSSPIWTNKGNCTYGNNTKTDSIFNFNLNYAQRKININWNIYKEFKTDYYEIERSTDSINFSAIERINSYRIPLLDTNYMRNDSLLFASKYYYRIKQVFYNDSVKYTAIIGVSIPFVNDSILQFDANITSIGIENKWNTTEFFTQKFDLNRSANNSNFQPIYTVNAQGNLNNNYTYLDTNPLEDSSFYKVIMQLQNGSFKISNTDTIYFPVNILSNFTTQKQQDSVLICFKVKHEKNVLYYEVQRSTDSIHFISIKTILPTSSLFDSVQYCVFDNQPFPGKNYYKIIAKYANGSTKETVIRLLNIVTGIAINKSNSIEFAILDNLITEGKNQLLIKSLSKTNSAGTIAIYDIQGRLYHQTTQEINTGISYFTLPISNLEAGKYFVIYYNNEFIIKSTFIVLHQD